MPVIAEDSLKMMEKDEAGLHHVFHRYRDCGRPCFSFDCNGKRFAQCEKFTMLMTGVKICKKERSQ